jgi:aminopeptidase YwaD
MEYCLPCRSLVRSICYVKGHATGYLKGILMKEQDLRERARTHLQKLCVDISTRLVGTPGNWAATDYVVQEFRRFGFATTCDEFACIEWRYGEARLVDDDGTDYPVRIGSYSLGVDVRAPLLTARDEDELAALDATGALLLLQDDLTQEQLMPKNFPFYNPEHHQRLIALLEAKAPAAILAATDSDPGLAGGISPFPLIEDGDFDIPSAYMTVAEGEGLAARAGQMLRLTMDATRVPATGCNVIGRKGRTIERLVFCAHVDAKNNTPGALDNATGVIVLLLMAELLHDYAGETTVELLVFNGEDFYSAPGEVLYVAQNADRFDEVVVAINIDGAGYAKGDTAFSFYGCSPDIEAALRRAFAAQPGMVEGPEWYQSDHSVFLQQGRPAVAVTSAALMDELMVHITHTPADHPGIIDPTKVVDIAEALVAFIRDVTG